MMHRDFRRVGRLAAATLLAACAAPPALPPAETPAPVATLPAEPPAPARLELVVAATTDIHGRVRGWDYYANAADTLR